MGGFWSKAAGWLTGLGCLSGGVACCFTGVGIAIGLPIAIGYPFLKLESRFLLISLPTLHSGVSPSHPSSGH